MSWLLPAAATIGGAALNFLGTGSSNKANIAIGRENNEFSAKQAQLNRDFQERMSNTQWQRGVGDMRAAGVNPMLAVSQGGASSPSGNSAQGIAQANQQNELATIASSARDLVLLQSQVKQIEAQTYASKAAGLASDTQAALNLTRAEFEAAHTNTERTRNVLESTKIPEHNLAAKVANSKFGMIAHLAERYGLNIQSALSVAKHMGKRRYSKTSRGTSYDSVSGEVL